MIELVNRLVEQGAILILCPGIVPEFIDEIQGVLGDIEFPPLHPLQLKFEFVGLDRGILVARDDIESGILYVRNALRLRTIRIYLHPPADTIILQVLDDMLVLHMRLIASLFHIEDFLPWIRNDLHPGSRIIGKSKVQSLYLHQVVHLRLDREFIYLLKLIDETIQCSLKSASVHFPPIGITLLVLNLPHLFCRQEWVVLVCRLDEDAVLLALHLILYPTHG